MRSFLRRTRVRLAAAVTAVFVVVAAGAATGVWFAFAHIEYGAVDTSVTDQAGSLLSGLQDANGRLSLRGGDSPPSQTTEGVAANAVLVDGRGRVLDSSGTALDPKTLSGVVANARRSGEPVYDTVSDGAHAHRVIGQIVEPGQSNAVLVVSRPIRELQQTLFLVAVLLASTVALLGVVVAVLAYHLSGRALRPVRAMAATARDISEQDLHRRIALDLPPDELGDLAVTFNGMLARLETAFAALRRFTADAAHELRAPVALLRAELEVSLSRPRTPAEYRQSQRIALAEAVRLGELADRLLLLSRADAGVLQPRLETFDVADLVEETVARWHPLARTREVALVVDMTEDRVSADPQLLRRLLDNLLDNAIRHSPDHGTVRIAARGDGSGWSMVVSDTGPGIPEGQRASLFERFTRGDAARGRDTGGAGLGLALCRMIAELHGGSISVAGGAPGACFRVRLPRRGEPGPAHPLVENTST